MVITKKEHRKMFLFFCYCAADWTLLELRREKSLAGRTGFEPVTFSVTGRRDNRITLPALYNR